MRVKRHQCVWIVKWREKKRLTEFAHPGATTHTTYSVCDILVDVIRMPQNVRFCLWVRACDDAESPSAFSVTVCLRSLFLTVHLHAVHEKFVDYLYPRNSSSPAMYIPRNTRRLHWKKRYIRRKVIVVDRERKRIRGRLRSGAKQHDKLTFEPPEIPPKKISQSYWIVLRH